MAWSLIKIHDMASIEVPEETALQSATQEVEVEVPDTARTCESVLRHHDADGIIEDLITKSEVDGANQHLMIPAKLNEERDVACQALAFRNSPRLQTMIPSLAS